jgi:mannose-6-phosphate isomerase-like protein (cupin superfamily)
MRVDFRNHSVDLKEGEFLVVQRGVEHRTVAEEGADVILFEPETPVTPEISQMIVSLPHPAAQFECSMIFPS